eukprot:6655-Heterococcus_DN1.PRE.1
MPPVPAAFPAAAAAGASGAGGSDDDAEPLQAPAELGRAEGEEDELVVHDPKLYSCSMMLCLDERAVIRQQLVRCDVVYTALYASAITLSLISTAVLSSTASSRILTATTYNLCSADTITALGKCCLLNISLHTDYINICVHGCKHTAKKDAALSASYAVANSRLSAHTELTSPSIQFMRVICVVAVAVSVLHWRSSTIFSAAVLYAANNNMRELATNRDFTSALSMSTTAVRYCD